MANADEKSKYSEPYPWKPMERDLIFKEEIRSLFLWCLHCERTYKRGEFRQIGNLQMCPYADCDGDTVVDAWEWESVRDAHPKYPKIPEKGDIYLLYPERK